jgi:hypothetical protein
MARKVNLERDMVRKISFEFRKRSNGTILLATAQLEYKQVGVPTVPSAVFTGCYEF